jgi:sugar/nucleoside kinase (ribokinase family)
VTDVVCLGILVADAIARPVDDVPTRGALELVDEISLHGGGCALNTASALVRLGLEAAVVGKVGADPFGDYILQLLDERGVDRRGVLQDSAVSTSATVVLVDSAGERTFLHLPGANGHLRREELDDEDALFSGRALHVAGALVMPELDGSPTAGVLEEAKARGLTTSLDTVWDATGRWERLLPSLPHLDLFVPSLAEGSAISGEPEPEAVAACLRERGVGTVALKLGAEGCFVASEEFEGFVAAPAVEAIDGTGSGDAFAAGLLYGRLAGWPLERAAALANAAGALAATAVGAVEGVRGLEETLALAGLESAA